jgi:hypothetical protein
VVSKSSIPIIILITAIITIVITGYSIRSDLTVLTQNDRYIGYELHQSTKWLWDKDSTYTNLDITPNMNGKYLLPKGNFNIFNTVILNQPEPQQITFNEITIPADYKAEVSTDNDGTIHIKWEAK